MKFPKEIESIDLSFHSYQINKNGKAAIVKEDQKDLFRPSNEFVLLKYMDKPFSFSYKSLEIIKLYNLNYCIKWALANDYIFIYKRPGQN